MHRAYLSATLFFLSVFKFLEPSLQLLREVNTK